MGKVMLEFRGPKKLRIVIVLKIAFLTVLRTDLLGSPGWLFVVTMPKIPFKTL